MLDLNVLHLPLSKFITVVLGNAPPAQGSHLVGESENHLSCKSTIGFTIFEYIYEIKPVLPVIYILI